MDGEQWLTWCSFADDERCRGVLILDGALDPIEACKLAHATGQNPGGNVLAAPIALRQFPKSEQATVLENVGKLLTAERARELFDGQSLREWEERQAN